MAVLTTINQPGAAIGDTFDGRSIIRVIADGNYVYGPAVGPLDVDGMLLQHGIAAGSSVTFSTPFSAGTTPSVFANAIGPGDNQNVTLQAVDHSGFTVWVVRNEGDQGIFSPTIHWIAVGEKP